MEKRILPPPIPISLLRLDREKLEFSVSLRENKLYLILDFPIDTRNVYKITKDKIVIFGATIDKMVRGENGRYYIDMTFEHVWDGDVQIV